MSDPLLQEERRLSQLVERAKVDGPRLGHSFRPSQDEALHMAWEYALAVVALAQTVEDAEAACKRLDAENFALRAWEPENELRGKIEDAERENERLRRSGSYEEQITECERLQGLLQEFLDEPLAQASLDLRDRARQALRQEEER